MTTDTAEPRVAGKFGRAPRKWDARTFHLTKYLTAPLLPPPPTLDLITEALQAAGEPIDVLFPMDGNDQYGDCTIAGVAHLDTMLRALVPVAPQQPLTAPADLVLKAYLQLTGGQDSGLACLDVLNWWRKDAFAADRVLYFAQIDPKNHTLVQQAMSIFKALYIGFATQQGCVDEFTAHEDWTPGPLDGEGHCVVPGGYDPVGPSMLTWGDRQRGTWAWWDECVEEVYAVILPETAAAAGLDLAALEADLAAVSGQQPPAPQPAPEPPQPPTPPVPEPPAPPAPPEPPAPPVAATGSVRFTVVDTAQQPVADAVVAYAGREQPTAQDGSTLFTSVAAGHDYFAMAWREGYGRGGVFAEAVGGETIEATLELPPA